MLATIGVVAGVYLSYPFCSQKCTYCNFASGVFPREMEQRYLAALRSEIEGHEWAWRPETVYLGGGTPGNLPVCDLQTVLALIPGRPWAEATLEAAPGTVTTERALGWFKAGINRVSLGAQSFVTAEIRRTGRKHTAETLAAEIRVLRDAGITNYNIDLIAGLSGQTEASWAKSLDWVERISPPHVSVYMLEVDEDSRLGKEVLAGGARYGAAETPGEDAVASFYETAVERLSAMGIERYEISNFALPGFESRHNLKYWRLEPYVGFGADAHSFDGISRRQNPEAAPEYIARRSGATPAGGTVTEPAHKAERFFVGLRLTAGIRPQPDEWRLFEQPIRRFIGAGLLETHDGCLRLTSRGVLLSNEVFQDFLDL